jgi:ribA/ribD-fused uncharacterized protein
MREGSTDIVSFSGKYAFLSNFHLCEVPFEGLVYPSAEHAYQAAKTLSTEERAFVRDVECIHRGKPHVACAAAAKKAGRTLTLREDWNAYDTSGRLVKVEEMKRVVLAKFENPFLLERLRNTQDALLIEGNTWGDTFWGCVWVMDQSDNLEGGWSGANWLGRILMEIREGL